MALLLKRKGITRVRPLAGGYEAWRKLGFPVTPSEPADESATHDSSPV